MALSEYKPAKQRKGPGCTVGVLVSSLDAEDRAELERWVAERATWSSIADSLQRALSQKFLPSTLSRHFGSPRKCSCDDTV